MLIKNAMGPFSSLTPKDPFKETFFARDLQVIKKPAFKPDLDNKEKLVFGEIPTDHMVEIMFTNGLWQAPRIIPFERFSIHPFNSTIHYGLSAFEGLKAYRNGNNLRLFRPMLNMKRFLESSKRICFPEFDPMELLKVLEEYVKLEKDWVPQKSGHSLYLRPVLLSQTNLLGIRPPNDTALYIMACPVSVYVSAKIKLLVNEDYWRGTPHSSAGYKIASNYAPTVKIAGDAFENGGYMQVIWTYQENFLESGASNLFFLLKNGADEYELVTAPLDGSILPGITRDSILHLAPQVSPGIKVSERHFSITEFIERYKNHTLAEVFQTGTAAIVGQVDSITLRGTDYKFKTSKTSWCMNLRKHLLDIQEGRIEHEFSHLIQQ